MSKTHHSQKFCLHYHGQTAWTGLCDWCISSLLQFHSGKSSVKKFKICKYSQKTTQISILTSAWKALGSSCLSWGTNTKCFWPPWLWYLTWVNNGKISKNGWSVKPTIQIKPALAWSELMIGARQPTDAVDRVVVSPYLSFRESPMPLMIIKIR